jgi:hypothetical protein
MAIIPNTHQTPNILVDDLMPLLKDRELRVYLFAVRHIYGWQDKIERGYAYISLSMFEDGFSRFEGCGLTKKPIIAAINELCKYGLLVKIGDATNKGQAYAIGQNPDIEALRNRNNTQKSSSGETPPVEKVHHKGWSKSTASSGVTPPNQSQDQNQDKVSPPDESDGQPLVKTKRKTPFGDGVIEAVAQPMFNATPDTIQKGNHVVYSVINGVRDAYKMVGDVPDNKDDVKHAVTDFLKWYARKYPNVPYVRQRSKLAMHYVEFLNSHKASQPSKAKQRINWSMRAQSELGYDTITKGLFNDEIDAKIAEYERMEMS